MISQNNEAWKILILDGLGAEARARVGFFVPNVPDDVKEELVPAMRWRPRCARRSRVVQSCASVAARIVSCFQTDRVVTCAELCRIVQLRRGMQSGVWLVLGACGMLGSRKVAGFGLCGFVHEMSQPFDFVDGPDLFAHRLLFRPHSTGEGSASRAWVSAKRSGIKANRFSLLVTRRRGPVASPWCRRVAGGRDHPYERANSSSGPQSWLSAALNAERYCARILPASLRFARPHENRLPPSCMMSRSAISRAWGPLPFGNG